MGNAGPWGWAWPQECKRQYSWMILSSRINIILLRFIVRLDRFLLIYPVLVLL